MGREFDKNSTIFPGAVTARGQHPTPGFRRGGLRQPTAPEGDFWQQLRTKVPLRRQIGATAGGSIISLPREAGNSAVAVPYPQTCSATWRTRRTFAHCSSSVSLLPISHDAKPH